MSNGLTPSTDESLADLEAKMQKVSLVVSLMAVGLMIGGSVAMLLGGTDLSLPGGSVLAFSALVHSSRAPASQVAMSAGILLLALLPLVRVLLALAFYTRWRRTLNAFVAILVFLELLVSMRTGSK